MKLEEIISGCKKNQRRAQEALYNLYAPGMIALCRRYVTSREDAEDVFHEAFVRVFKKIDLYVEGNFNAWIKRVFVNTAINYYHRNKKYTEFIELDQDKLDINSINDEVAAVELQDISAEQLLKYIDMLPDGYRVVFNMYVIEGFCHKEISEVLNISEGTSKSQLYKAKVYLKNVLKEHGILNRHVKKA